MISNAKQLRLVRDMLTKAPSTRCRPFASASYAGRMGSAFVGAAPHAAAVLSLAPPVLHMQSAFFCLLWLLQRIVSRRVATLFSRM
jgi:hypothetical protein